jgi:glycerol-3-phosphate dehydrogenase subunit B
LEYEGAVESSFRLPTALGSALYAAFAPKSVAAGDLHHGPPFLVAGIEGFRDFHPEIVAANLTHLGAAVEGAVTLPLISGPRNRDAYATDLAALFDDVNWLEETARAWKPRIGPAKRLALPAVVGLHRPARSLELLRTRLGMPIFEIPTLPPCLPGLRLERGLRSVCLAAGVRLVEGATAVGLVDGRSGGMRVAGVVAHSAGGPWEVKADATILATGGILNGGLVAQADGRVQESIFDLPVVHTQDRSTWTDASPWSPHAYTQFGLRVNSRMQPVGRDGRPMFENLLAIGGVLAGADRAHEGSRQGIDIATAYRAIEVLLG